MISRPPIPQGYPLRTCYAHGDEAETDRSRERTTAAAPAQIVTSWPPLPAVCVWHRTTTGPTTAARAGPADAGRTIAGTDAQPVRGDAQSRTEDAQPQAVRIAENVTVYLHPDDATAAARTGHSPAADRRETTVHCHVMSIGRI